MLCLFLISVCLGSLGIKSYRAIQQQRFHSHVEVLISKIALAHQIRLAFHTDVLLKLELKEGCLNCDMQVVDPIPAHLASLLQRDRELKGIKHFEFEGSRDSDTTLFFPWGSQQPMSRGNLWLSASPVQDEGIYLPLLGYPAPLAKSSSKIAFKSLDHAPYPNEIETPLPVK